MAGHQYKPHTILLSLRVWAFSLGGRQITPLSGRSCAKEISLTGKYYPWSEISLKCTEGTRHFVTVNHVTICPRDGQKKLMTHRQGRKSSRSGETAAQIKTNKVLNPKKRWDAMVRWHWNAERVAILVTRGVCLHDFSTILITGFQPPRSCRRKTLLLNMLWMMRTTSESGEAGLSGRKFAPRLLLRVNLIIAHQKANWKPEPIIQLPPRLLDIFSFKGISSSWHPLASRSYKALLWGMQSTRAAVHVGSTIITFLIHPIMVQQLARKTSLYGSLPDSANTRWLRSYSSTQCLRMIWWEELNHFLKRRMGCQLTCASWLLGGTWLSGVKGRDCRVHRMFKT